MNDFISAVQAMVNLVEKSPVAIRAIRIFGEHVLKGQTVRDSLVKTAEILAAESLI